MRIKDKHWFNVDCRYTFKLKKEANLWCTWDRCRENSQVRANEVYVEARRQITARSRYVLVVF